MCRLNLTLRLDPVPLGFVTNDSLNHLSHIVRDDFSSPLLLSAQFLLDSIATGIPIAGV